MDGQQRTSANENCAGTNGKEGGGEGIGGLPEVHVTDVLDLIVILPQPLLQCIGSIGIQRLREERGQLVKRHQRRGEGL